jgi:hypothetical protein
LTATGEASAWNPGIQSPVPPELRHLCTIFRFDNVLTGVEAADELCDLTGLPATELVAFRPERLALHEVLIRISADYAVPDGARIGDLGINFRQMVRRLLTTQVEPHMSAITASFEDVRRRALDTARAVLTGVAGQGPPVSRISATRGGWFGRLRRHRMAAPSYANPSGYSGQSWHLGHIEACERRAKSSPDELERAVCRMLARLMAAVFNRQGGAWGSWTLLSTLAVDLVCNELGADAIGRTLEPLLQQAAANEGYYRVPAQTRPLVMNTKGPSAAGKSSLRPLQRELAGAIGVRWGDFALISPDIWRKQLLDYDSLGPLYKYAGPMTSDELQIVDAKLDRYMARKYERGDMSHLLIDRFRFDSFAPNSNEAGSNLLTRFGQTVYLFFVIAAPESLVERAWQRGLEFGRFKAVGDTLAHAVQAYAGIPDLFFTWIGRDDKSVHFEFLDNSVPLGRRPRTAAFGDNRVLYVLDVGRILDIERFRRINIAANTAQALYPDPTRLAPEHNIAFLQRCVQGMQEVIFADQATGQIFLRMVAGRAVAADRHWLETVADPDTQAGVRAVAPAVFEQDLPLPQPALCRPIVGVARAPTLGQWGGPPAMGDDRCA